MINQVKANTPLLFKLLQIGALLVNLYYLIHMFNLNIVFGKGITFDAVWKQLCFLTNLDHILILFYHLWSILTFLKGQQRSHSLKKFYQFVFNLSFLASVIYWAIRSIDPKLVHGKYSPEQLGEVYQIFIHGFNHFLLFLELFIEDKQNEWSSSFLQFTPFALLYTVQIAIEQFYFGRYVYPFFKLIKPYGFLITLASIPVLVVIDNLYTQRLFNHFQSKYIVVGNNTKNKTD
ncbi:hypothetical protein ABPG72_006905 [Tetrahymena utriculariae]